jgi:hypothetical protein
MVFIKKGARSSPFSQKIEKSKKISHDNFAHFKKKQANCNCFFPLRKIMLRKKQTKNLCSKKNTGLKPVFFAFAFLFFIP